MLRCILSSDPPDRVDADLLVLPVAAGADGPVAPPSTRAVLDRLGTDLDRLAPLGTLRGRLDDAVLVPTLGALAAPALLLVGVGADGERGPETLRRAASVAVGRAAGAKRLATTLATCPLAGAEAAVAVAAVAEGMGLTAYRFDRHRAQPSPAPTELLLLVDGSAGGAEAGLRRAEAAVRATAIARDLVNEPGNHIDPATLAAEAVRLAGRHGWEHRVLEGQALRDGGFGALLAVGGGSAVPPRLVELRHRPAGAARHVALVGKGVTFDSGGIDLKRGDGMAGMKDDMAGAAAVLGALAGATELELGTAVTAFLPLVENMPGGAAARPGDVVRARNGTTIEITNTDAEGRLILADALSLAAESAPDAIVDVATLTGSAVAGLGRGCSALLGNDPELVSELLTAAGRTGEPVAALPLIEDYRPMLDSDLADVCNAADHRGDAIQAALFLREFVGGRRWAHLDIAGPATRDAPLYYEPKGGTGCMTRTLLEYLIDSGGSFEHSSPPNAPPSSPAAGRSGQG